MEACSLSQTQQQSWGHRTVRQQGREARFKALDDRVEGEEMGQGRWAGRMGLEAASWPGSATGGEGTPGWFESAGKEPLLSSE